MPFLVSLLQSHYQHEINLKDAKKGKTNTHIVRGCPDEIAKDPHVCKKWAKVAQPTKAQRTAGANKDDGTWGDNNGVHMQEEHIPMMGTRKDFFNDLKCAFEKFIRQN